MKEASRFFYKLQLSYKGTRYHGWQNQTSTSETIQNYVEKVLAEVVNYQDFQVIGASRTDSGVHATGQVLKLILPREICPLNLAMGMNSKLPNDIKVVVCELTHEKFNVSNNSKFKEYHYYFSIDKHENALISELVYTLPEDLDLELMQQACDKLIGKHNFMSFCVPGPRLPFSHRDVLKCSIEKTRFLTCHKEIYYLKIVGTGFLKYMVRFLMGAIWDIGRGKLSLEDFSNSLIDGEKHGVRTKAPARGLHLIHIEY